MKKNIKYKGYKIEIMQDEGPENPFKDWDCEPPLIVHGLRGYSESYQGAPETMAEVVGLMPTACFKRGQRVALIKAMLNCTLREFAEVKAEMYQHDDSATQEAFAQLATEQVGAKPGGWRAAIEWMEMAESLLNWAGIPCLNTQSNGYTQGDSTLLLVILTPDWVKTVGASPEHNDSNMQGAADLYGAWAWGDVYGVSAIYAPGEDEDDDSGEEIKDGSCWGFYGWDHEKSGLMEHARSAIDYHIERQRLTALNEPACLI